MAYVKEKDAHTVEIYAESGVRVATVQFDPKTNAARRPNMLRDAGERWEEGRSGLSEEGTPMFRKAMELRNMFNGHIQSSPDFGAGKQRDLEKRVFEALRAYTEYFRDPRNKTAKRDHSYPKSPMVNRPPHESWQDDG